MAEQRTPSNWDDYRKAWAVFGQTMDFLKKEGGVNKENTDAAVKTALASVESALRKEAEKYVPKAKEKTANKRGGDPASKAGIIRRLRAVSQKAGLPGKGHGVPFSPTKLPAVKAAKSFYAKLDAALTEIENGPVTRPGLNVLLKKYIGKAYLTPAQYEAVTTASDSEAKDVHIPPKDGVKNGNGVNDASRPQAVNPAKSGVTASKERTAKAVAKAVAKPAPKADKPAKVGPKTEKKGNTMTVLAGASKAGSRRARRAARNAKRAG